MCMQFAYGLNSGGIQAVYQDKTDARLWSLWAHKVSILCQKERLKYLSYEDAVQASLSDFYTLLLN